MSARRAHAVLVPYESAPATTRTEAICRVRLAPGLSSQAFEQWLKTVPTICSAVCLTGDVDYELRLCCRDFAELGEVIGCLRGCGGAEVASTALVLREVPGLGGKAPRLRRLPRPR
jgi:hypothetical protein